MVVYDDEIEDLINKMLKEIRENEADKKIEEIKKEYDEFSSVDNKERDLKVFVDKVVRILERGDK